MSHSCQTYEVHIMLVAGARPNFPKLKPVLDAIEERKVQTTFVHTGQHYDSQMSDVFLEELGIRLPDISLGIGSGTQGVQTARIIESFEPIVNDLKPDIVVVVGDVNSTVACALVGAKSGSRIAHVEAGLRSRDWRMPEEVNRVVTDRLSDYLFAPSEDAVSNLQHEGYRSDQIFLAGNVMIDTLEANRVPARLRLPELFGAIGISDGNYCLVTLHRPSNVDDASKLGEYFLAFQRLSETIPVIFPVHPRTRAQLNELRLEPRGNFQLLEPCGYLDFLALQSAAAVVVTDSGGVQEETTALGVPCLTVRDSTERPITVTEGTNKVIGANPNQISFEVRRVLENGIEIRRPKLWDGRAGVRIAEVLVTDPNIDRRPTSF